MNYFLFDNPEDKLNMEFINQNSSLGYKLIFPKKRCRSIKTMIQVCHGLIRQTQAEDNIICWYDFMGVICWWICKLTHRRRHIIALNILLKEKNSRRNKLARKLYRKAMLSNDFKASVTSPQYGEWLKNYLHIDRTFPVIHDVCHVSYDIQYNGEVQNNSIFCGGRNGRDWFFLFKLANALPDVTFNVITSNDIYTTFKKTIPKNVRIQLDTTVDVFLKTMCKSTAVAIPLDTEAPAGLIALFQAGANKKCVLATRTITTNEYITEDRGVLLEKDDLDLWKDAIIRVLENSDETIKKAKNFQQFLFNNCSEQEFMNGVDRLVLS